MIPKTGSGCFWWRFFGGDFFGLLLGSLRTPEGNRTVCGRRYFLSQKCSKWRLPQTSGFKNFLSCNTIGLLLKNPQSIRGYTCASGQRGADSVAATAGIELCDTVKHVVEVGVYWFRTQHSVREVSRAPQAKKIAPQARKNLDIAPQYWGIKS